MANLVLTSTGASGGGGPGGGGGGLFAPPVPAGNDVGTLNVSVFTEQTPTAPAFVGLEVTGASGFAAPLATGTAYQAYLREITYIGWVSELPEAPFISPQNMNPAWNKTCFDMSPNQGFVLPQGTWTLNIMGIDREQDWGVWSQQITVANADTKFPGAQTICFSTAGFGDAPAGATQVTSLSALQSAITANSNPKRLLTRRGESLLGLDISTNGGRLDEIGHFGDDQDPLPVLRPGEFSDGTMITFHSGGGESEPKIWGQNMRGYWDPINELGPSASPFTWDGKSQNLHALLYQNEIRGFDTNMPLDHGNDTNSVIAVVDNINEDWRNFGLYAGGNNSGFLCEIGNRIVQNPLAGNGGPKPGTANTGGAKLYNNHGPHRVPKVRRARSSRNDYFSNAGWSGLQTQHCQRWKAAGDPLENDRIFTGMNCMENGYMLLSFEGENSGASDLPGNYLVENSLFVGSARTKGTMAGMHAGGAFMRNVIFFSPNTDKYDSGRPTSGASFTPNNPQSTNLSEPVGAVHCLAISLLDAANESESGSMQAIDVSSLWTGYEAFGRNIDHAPNSASPDTPAAPIQDDVGFEWFRPRYQGPGYGYERVTDSLGGSVANNADFVVPYSDVIIQDMDGNGSGAATTQSYWQTHEATDTNHMLIINGQTLHARSGAFVVSYQSDGIHIENRTGSSWSGTWHLKLDRSSHRFTDLPLDASLATPALVPTGKPRTGSSALTPGSGETAVFDFDVRVRPLGGEFDGPWQEEA